MPRVKCVNCLRVYRQKLVDAETGKPAGHANMCECDVLGDMQEIGFECGKGFCELYRKEDKCTEEAETARPASGGKSASRTVSGT